MYQNTICCRVFERWQTNPTLIYYPLNQIDEEKMKNEQSLKEIIHTVFTGIAVAMGIAVIVTNILGSAELQTQILLLGIGLSALAINLLDKE